MDSDDFDRVDAIHTHWTGTLRLSRSTNSLIHEGHGSRGVYVLSDDKLKVFWDRYEPETFIKLSRFYVHQNFLPGYEDTGKPGSKKISVLIPGKDYAVDLRLQTSDIETFEQIFISNDYNSSELPNSAEFIVDLGATVGLSTVFFGLKYPQAKILSVEPESGNFDVMTRNTAALGDRIQKLHAAVSIKDGEINLDTEGEDGASLDAWGVQVSDRPGGRLTPCFKLNTLIETAGFERIDILKVDIEGAELDIFAHDAAEWLPKVNFIIVETHDRFRPGSKGALRKAVHPQFDELPRSGGNLLFRRRPDAGSEPSTTRPAKPAMSPDERPINAVSSRDRGSKTACIILCQNAASVLRHTAPVYAAAGWDIFLHIDRKVSQEHYVATLEDAAKLCTVVPNPVEVFWGGYTMIKAQLAAIDLARASGSYERFILLTDDAIPLRTPNVLKGFFEDKVDYITRHLQVEGIYYNRYARFFTNDYPPTKMRGRHQDYVYAEDDFIEAVSRLGALKKRGKRDIPVYFGSQFWALTAGAIDMILDTIAKDPWLVESFEFSALPDELMFQTIVGNFGRAECRDGPMYADFSVAPGPRVLKSIADIKDAPAHTVFARKVDPEAEIFIQVAMSFLLGNRAL